jgi:hypothetical protein
VENASLAGSSRFGRLADLAQLAPSGAAPALILIGEVFEVGQVSAEIDLVLRTASQSP